MLPKSLDADALRTLTLASVGASIMLVLIVLRFVQKMVLRVVLVGALVGAGLYAWSQRAELSDCAPPTCACTFAGYDVQVDTPGCRNDQETEGSLS